MWTKKKSKKPRPFSQYDAAQQLFKATEKDVGTRRIIYANMAFGALKTVYAMAVGMLNIASRYMLMRV